jgi:hypothetical protein
MNEQKTRIEARFLYTLFMLMLGLICLVINDSIYNWVFIPRYYQENPKTYVITWSQIKEYLLWFPGGCITLLNISLLIPSVVMFWKRPKHITKWIFEVFRG